jgi:hypothetical protein
MAITEPTINDRGDEEHPSFGVVTLSRVSAAPGAWLFDSSTPHNQYVRLEVSRATRRRDLHKDWIHSSNTASLIDLNMSLTQWGSLVSSFNQGSGTPVTIHRVLGELQPEAPHSSRLAETAREVADAARKSTVKIQAAAQAVVAAYAAKGGRREMGELIENLSRTIEGVPSNMKFAADTLTRHAEDVVSKAKADIEAAQTPGPVLTGPHRNHQEIEASHG